MKVLNEIHIKLKKYIFEYIKLEKKMTKVGFEHRLIFQIRLLSKQPAWLSRLKQTHAKLNGSGISYSQQNGF